MMLVEKFCIHCFERTPVELRVEFDRVELHDELIIYEADRYLCTRCGKFTDDDELTDKNFSRIYRAYQQKKGMLSAADFRYVREELYQISVRLMAKLIGWSPATISRYENGGLQTKKHDTHFKAYRDPHVMKMAFENYYDEIDEKPRIALEERLSFLFEAIKNCEVLKGLDDRFELLDVSSFGNENKKTSVFNVEKYFIMRGQAFENGEEHMAVSPLKLQKLMYYAQGWTHAYTGEALFDADFQAWRHGPVIPDVYRRYKSYGFKEIDQVDGGLDAALNLHVEQQRILEWVWDKYSKFEAKYLEEMTHQERPWRETRGDLPADAKCDWVIDKEGIFSYFDSLYETIKLMQVD